MKRQGGLHGFSSVILGLVPRIHVMFYQQMRLQIACQMSPRAKP